jgi:serine/threonine protein kinase
MVDSSSSLVTAQGTFAWMAPEALRGDAISKSADVYSFGVVAWECITKERPWTNLKETPWANLQSKGPSNIQIVLPAQPDRIASEGRQWSGF